MKTNETADLYYAPLDRKWVCKTCYERCDTRKAVEEHLKTQHGVNVQRNRLQALQRRYPR